MNRLASLYGAMMRARNQLYDRGALPVHRLQGPVVSVGNLTVGGAGKTPFVIALGELLRQRGVAFDVLSRGYRRATKGVKLVDPKGSPCDFGDEPLLIARKLRVPVIVAEDRYAGGRFAEKELGTQLHLLDDGFQHRHLAREFDIVLVTPADVKDSLLPAGRLREPLSSLSRADAVVLTNQMAADGLPLAGRLVWRVRRGIVPPDAPDPCFAFCGIARPENFFADLSAAGITLVATKAFPDHHVYTRSDVRRLLGLRRQHTATAFLTTEKDAINLGTAIADLAPLHVVPVRMQLDAPGAVIDALLARIAQRNPQSA